MLAITVPKLRTDHSAAEVRPRRVEDWLQSLPQADARYSAQQIHQALFAQNRIRLDHENRLSLMELYCEPVATAVETMRQSYMGVALPLSVKTQKLVGFIQRLLTEMANGYKIVANDLAQQGITESRRPDTVMALQRAVALIGELILTAYEVYMPPPTGIWRQLHELYRFAESSNLLHSPVGAEEIEVETEESITTVEESCLRILLLGACSPFGLLPGECRRVYDLLPSWHDRMELSDAIDLTDPDGRFLVSLQSDVAPIPLSKVAKVAPEAHLRVLDAVGVIRKVQKILRSLPKEKPTSVWKSTSDRIEVTDADMLRRLRRLLVGVATRRHSTRTGEGSEVMVCIGVSAIHYFASGERKFEHNDSKSVAGGDGLMAPLVEIGTADEAEEPIDIECLDPSDPNFGDKPEDTRGDAASIRWQEATDYKLLSFYIVNESAGGLGLQTRASTDVQLKVGDLLGIQYPSPDRLRLAVVRWVQQKLDDSLGFGVQMVAPAFRPVAVKKVAANGSSDGPYIRGLLLPKSTVLRQPESIILPRGLYQQDDNFSLLIDDEEGPTLMAPGRLVDRTGSFDMLLLGVSSVDMPEQTTA